MQQAVSLAAALGGTLLLADDLKKHYKQLAAAMASRGSDGGLDGGPLDTSPIDCRFDLGGFDLSGFDAYRLSALDARPPHSMRASAMQGADTEAEATAAAGAVKTSIHPPAPASGLDSLRARRRPNGT